MCGSFIVSEQTQEGVGRYRVCHLRCKRRRNQRAISPHRESKGVNTGEEASDLPLESVSFDPLVCYLTSVKMTLSSNPTSHTYGTSCLPTLQYELLVAVVMDQTVFPSCLVPVSLLFRSSVASFADCNSDSHHQGRLLLLRGGEGLCSSTPQLRS